MKSERRHNLETNELAHGLAVFIDKYRPYFRSVGIGFLAAAVLYTGMKLYAKSNAAREATAWDSYASAVEGGMPDIEMLKNVSNEFPSGSVHSWSQITWADGQVWAATRNYWRDRKSADENLALAESAYQTLIRSASEPKIVERARFGLARVYEMRNELDKAIAQYKNVGGSFANLAQLRADELEKKSAQEVCAWIEAAGPAKLSSGPDLLGGGVEFKPDSIQLPEDNKLIDTSETEETPDRYKEDSAAEGEKATADSEQPADKEADSEKEAGSE